MQIYRKAMNITQLNFCKPEPADGPALHALIKRCPPLDTNSVYCNLLQCSDFAQTSIAVKSADGSLLGFVSGYVPPARLKTLFIWQVAVAPECRGQQLAKRMLHALVRRVSADKSIAYLETTITPGNQASEALFERFFNDLSAPVETSVLFSKEQHFYGQHEDEVLYRAGPFIVQHSSTMQSNTTQTH